MEDKLAREMVKALQANTAELKRSNDLTKAVLKASGNPPAQVRETPQRVDPLTAHLQTLGR